MRHYKLITCVIQEKLSNQIIKKLQEEQGILTANKFSAKGSSFVEHLEVRQMDVLTVIIDEDKADELFTFLYLEAQIDRPHGGLIFQETVRRSTEYTLPSIENKE